MRPALFSFTILFLLLLGPCLLHFRFLLNIAGFFREPFLYCAATGYRAVYQAIVKATSLWASAVVVDEQTNVTCAAVNSRGSINKKTPPCHLTLTSICNIMHLAKKKKKRNRRKVSHYRLRIINQLKNLQIIKYRYRFVKKEKEMTKIGFEGKKTYNTWDSLVVTDPTTSQAIGSLSMGERTGSRVFYHLWSYVIVLSECGIYIPKQNPRTLSVFAVPGLRMGYFFRRWIGF